MDVKNGSHDAARSESPTWCWSISNTPTAENHDSKDDGTAIEINSGTMFGLDDLDVNEIDQPVQSDDFMMIFDEDESSGSEHSTSKPMEKKMKKKLLVTGKEFLSLQSKVDQISAAIIIHQSQQSDTARPHSLAERVEWLETREPLAAERISLKSGNGY